MSTNMTGRLTGRLGGDAAHGFRRRELVGGATVFCEAQTGEMREIYKPKLQIADPRVSPDGKNVAFIEGLMSDEGSTGGDIHVVPTREAWHEISRPTSRHHPLLWLGRVPTALRLPRMWMEIPASAA